ncbi:MAG: adenosylmethionine--8-amino-7-oxononanoate transaminase [Verrucomicrobia bacterium]|nr:adenosylmethionine--8-amino-7-oxononanoate transaminase [Verrucomicrobiota bacterium]MBU1735998.1 adenosylmethionine--8-amino-7-oxononanoate transaminase [Verrucomicrobiota bacterium]MBU1856286.1 adenosylmethionine--8-amino-7-oxononanoate transaminase [Verrucomicrobiota bacterium]
MNTENYRDLDRQHLWHPYSRHSAMRDTAFPVIVRGEGVYLFDSDGRRYLDAISSWWACNLGHSHPRLVKAMTSQAQCLQHSILGNLSHPGAIELAARLAELFPDRRRRVFFSGDGASAVEAALKIAVQYWYNRGRPERRRFVSLGNAYHGDTLGAVSVGYVPEFHAPFQPLLFPVYRAEAPCCGTCAHNPPPSAVADCVQECVAPMADILEKNAAKIAAVIVEPICQGAAGMRIYAPACLAKMAALCRKHDVLLIADEIAMGFGRTGRMFAFEHAGIDPDIVCLGKGLAGGYLPMSATIVREALYETFTDQPADHTFYHGHTFAGNPVTAAVALETLRIYEEDRIVEHARKAGERLQEAMAPIRGLSGVRDVRGLGLLAVVELAESKGQSGPARARRMAAWLLQQGILIRPLGSVVYLMPPLITPDPVLDQLVGQVREALAQCS